MLPSVRQWLYVDFDNDLVSTNLIKRTKSLLFQKQGRLIQVIARKLKGAMREYNIYKFYKNSLKRISILIKYCNIKIDAIYKFHEIILIHISKDIHTAGIFFYQNMYII